MNRKTIFFICRNSEQYFDQTDPKCKPGFPVLVSYIYATFRQKISILMNNQTGKHFFYFQKKMTLTQLTPTAIPTCLSWYATYMQSFIVTSQFYTKLLTGNQFSMFGYSGLDPLTPNAVPNCLSLQRFLIRSQSYMKLSNRKGNFERFFTLKKRELFLYNSIQSYGTYFAGSLNGVG